MIVINEDQWDDIKRDFLSEVDCEFTEEPLMHFNAKTNMTEEIGKREVYEFSKNEMDYMIILDKEIARDDAERVIFKLSVKFKDQEGNWKDSSALESNFE